MNKEDEPLDKAKRALKKAQRTAQSLENPDTGQEHAVAREPGRRTDDKAVDEESDGLSDLPLVGGMFRSLDTIWQRSGGRVFRILQPLLTASVRFYRWSYRRFGRESGTDGASKYAPLRVIAVTIALAILTVLVPYTVVRHGIPLALKTSYDGIMLMTVREDSLFLGRPDIIDAEREIYQVTGCRDIGGCDGGDNTIYYRLRPNLILSLQYWFSRFEPYDPAEISSAMVSELNECTVRYYGRRVKAFGWYPYIVKASCRPVSAP